MYSIRYKDQNRIKYKLVANHLWYKEPFIFLYLEEDDKFYLRPIKEKCRGKQRTINVSDYLKNYVNFSKYDQKELNRCNDPILNVIRENSIDTFFPLEGLLKINDNPKKYILNYFWIEYYDSDGERISSMYSELCQCGYSYTRNVIAKVKNGVVCIGCWCGLIKVFDMEKSKLSGEFSNEDKFQQNTVIIRAMTNIKENIIAVANGNNKIKLWKIFNSYNSFHPLCLHVFHGINANFLHKDIFKNVLYAGGEDGFVTCYNLEYPFIDQWVLKFVKSKNREKKRLHKLKKRQAIREKNWKKDEGPCLERKAGEHPQNLYETFLIDTFNIPYGIDKLSVYKILQKKNGLMYIINYAGMVDVLY